VRPVASWQWRADALRSDHSAVTVGSDREGIGVLELRHLAMAGTAGATGLSENGKRPVPPFGDSRADMSRSAYQPLPRLSPFVQQTHTHIAIGQYVGGVIGGQLRTACCACPTRCCCRCRLRIMEVRTGASWRRSSVR
jgi:hypothetical protein